MTENDRLKHIRVTLNLTQREFSDALEIKQGSYSDVERGKAGISALLLKNLIRKFRVNPLWLCEGEGDMIIGHVEPSEKDTKESGSRSGVQPDENNVNQLERQRQYIDNIKDVMDFINS